MTWSHKILAKAAGLDKVAAGQNINFEVDHCIINDGVSNRAVDLIKDEKDIKNKDSVMVILDHDIPAGSFDSAFIQKKLIDFSKQYDLNFIQSAGTTYELISNQIEPGDIVAVCGNHNGAFGVNGGLGIRLSIKEMAKLLTEGRLFYKVPECINVVLNGKLPEGVSQRDFMLNLIACVQEGYKGYIVEITGEAVRQLNKTDKFTICSLMSRTGAESVLIADEADGIYAKKFHYSLEDAETVITMPGDLNAVKTSDELKGTKINAGFIGACTGGHIEDLRLAANILKGKRIKLGFRLLIGCVSNEVFLQAMDEGLIDVFFDFGAQVTNPGCASCKTTSIGVVGDGESLISTGSYNFAGCAGTKDSKVYLASVETVARTAISGFIGE